MSNKLQSQSSSPLHLSRTISCYHETIYKKSCRSDSFQHSFTLVELLIVIGILAILTAAIIVVLNPAELLKQARDSKRIQDLSGLENNINISQALAPNISLGTASTVYVSIADDTSSSCATLSLPSLPAGYSYACVTESNLHNTDGTGWIPINFQDTNLAGAIQLSSLPIDPTNTTSTNLYYTYTTGGSYELNALIESDKYRTDTTISKPNLPGIIAKGDDLTLSPLSNTSGLVGYWPFEEGSGTTTQDSSGNGNTGTLTNGPLWAEGKVGNWALEFDGSDDYVGTGSDVVGTGDVTVVAWLSAQSAGENNYGRIFGNGAFYPYINGALGSSALFITSNDRANSAGSFSLIQNSWEFVAITRTSSGTLYCYIDGVVDSGTTNSGTPQSGGNFYIGEGNDLHLNFDGYIDDMRVYNRALSAAEIQAIYNANR